MENATLMAFEEFILMVVQLPKLKPGAIIDIIAPAGRFNEDSVSHICALLAAQKWQARIDPTILAEGYDFLAASDAERLRQLKQALYADDSDVVWCVRGGHGTTRLLQDFQRWPIPQRPKLLVGFSDITTLHLAINQHWHWPSLHAPMAERSGQGLSDPRDLDALWRLWQGGLSDYELGGLIPHNAAAAAGKSWQGISAGTCLSLLQTSIGTEWQLASQGKVLFIEDINEPAYRLDRMLMHLHNVGLWQKATAIVLGDFAVNLPAVECQKIGRVLTEFATAQTVPVFALAGFGHGPRNRPIPLGVHVKLEATAGGYRAGFGHPPGQ